MIFRKGELFCGPGGIGYGARNVRVENNGEVFSVRHEWANDVDMNACLTFARNVCESDDRIITEDETMVGQEVDNARISIVCKDIRELDITQLPPIDALTFGFPCNDFSNVGERRGFNGEYGPLYTYGVRCLEHHAPQWFIAENVGGLTNANDGEAFRTILNDLNNPELNEYGGYEIVPHYYRFEEYGVPQCRHRVIIVGIRRDIVEERGIHFVVPAPTTPDHHRTTQEAFERGLNDNEGNVQNAIYNNERTVHPLRTIQRLQAIPEGQNAWYDGIPEELRLNVRGARLSNIYKRLDRNQPAYTVTGSGGGGTHMYHYEENRALTNRERARLQTFPDDFIFEGGREAVRKQVGMAVPPLGVEVIVRAVLDTFAGIEYDSVPARWDMNEI